MPNRPIPSALRKLSGSNLHRINPHEARFIHLEAVHIPKRVERDEEAKAEWERVVPELVRNGLLNRVNISILAEYCLTYGQLQHAHDRLFEDGPWIMTPIFGKKGECLGDRKTPHPAIVQISNFGKDLMRFADAFGMTPSAAVKVQAQPQEKENVFAKMIAQEESEDSPNVQ